ncbi:MAG: group II intron reverse transcriptase/maturase [Methylococcaceae bacterium]|nr:group II intron reverse transcriptase/maturase [Methylococcaceae bacterium]MDZ4155090.1 group II intron reverse transcriptase/maturase [Methylococcales bacterium]MDP2394465.1 group II intron reverse transcriptase/maturase [Methylococcaceae bacterium]MDP3021508.1 group II intron reverse transcriptase/maturase [Methylococcaceae bacterium]MDP3390373.1 group II intron reverse transcriptase/maturase [Methylococcaceae bacterium]
MTTESMMDAMFNWLNLQEALDAVKRNKGAAGIDGKSIAETERHIEQYWPQIEAKLRTGSYIPSPVKGVKIPKPNGGERLLGIPTVQDRIIQQAMNRILTVQFDRGFSQYSYGFRPYLSAHHAVKQAQLFVQQGKNWVIDLDISAFFDEVNHDILLHQISQTVTDNDILDLIRKYLKAGIIVDGKIERRGKGVPQGSPLSPLLANCYLDKLDKELEKRELSFCRYADDLTIYASSERSAKRILASLIKWLEKHLKLSVNQNKSGTGRPWESQFLGFRITRDGGEIAIAPKSIERYKASVRRLWDARQSLTSKQLVEQWRKYCIGWWNYFKLATKRWHIRRWAGWTHRHIRKCFWQRWHNKKGRLNALRRLGVNVDLQKTASSSRGAWRIAASPALHKALNNATLRRYGLYAPSELSAA